MGVPTSEVRYTPAMPRREDHEVHKGHVGALGGEGKKSKGHDVHRGTATSDIPVNVWSPLRYSTVEQNQECVHIIDAQSTSTYKF